MKILILKPSSLGDVLHAIPVLRLLKRHLPKSEIYWWLDHRLAPLLEGDPDLAGIIPFRREDWANPARWPEMFGSLRQMRHQHFDWAIDLQGLARSALFTWLSGARLTVGLDNPREGVREGARAFYDITPPPSPPGTHSVDRYRAVLAALNVPNSGDFEWLPSRPAVAEQVRRRWSPDGARWVALLPGGRWDNKRWPAERFVELVKMMENFPGVRFVALGAPNERDLAQSITSASPRCLNLAGETSLWEMIEWLRLCSLVVTNDTGPMHVAAALRRPLLAVFGPTEPSSTGPYGQADHVLQNRELPCVPCMKSWCSWRDPLACLTSIPAAAVYARAQSLLGAS